MVEALTSQGLLSFLKTQLQSRSFTLFVHILTEPFISFFCELPEAVKNSSRIYLDEEKYIINDYAVRRLRECGYKKIYYVRRLHAKLLLSEEFVVVGSANYSERSLSNHEIVVVIWKNYRDIPGLARIARNFTILALPAEEHKNENSKTDKMEVNDDD